ncbi:hypothetical protein C8N40_110128 [Pontibacter mucosus]|uniref:Uncharacterized protein n=1 Tax=Pontibacter mucosus TaxID=1649266 RepID=A0A2T5YDS5_9BACT|nr:hypothetical protein [Pontibacter mucosus]PTX14699.1 hypothetical protein C8N40_110128 [Pontibacter mucosus]
MKLSIEVKINNEQLVSIIKQMLTASGGVFTEEIQKLIDNDLKQSPDKYDSYEEIEADELWLEGLPLDPFYYEIQPGDMLMYGNLCIPFCELYLYAHCEITRVVFSTAHWFYKHIKTKEIFHVEAHYDTYHGLEASTVKKATYQDIELIALGCTPDVVGYNKASRKHRIPLIFE